MSRGVQFALDPLRNQVEEFLSRSAQREYRKRAGLASPPLRELYDSFPELHQPETFAALREAADSVEDQREAKRYRLLSEFIASRIEEGLARSVSEEIATRESEATFGPGAEQRIAFRDALVRLKHEPIREGRQLLEQRVGEWLWENQDWYARRIEAAEQASRALGARSYLTLRDEVGGYSSAHLADECHRLLSATEDAYRDVLGYVLKRVDSSLRPMPSGSATLPDLEYAQNAPWMSGWFLRDELLPVVTRCLTEMGLPPRADGRIQVDAEDPPEKEEGSFVARLNVPDDVRVVVKPSGGIESFSNLLSAFSRAQHAARTARSSPVEERRLGDSSVTEGYARCFEHLMMDEDWHRRYLHLPRASAREAARLAAFRSLVSLRRYCAQLPYEITLYQRGPVRSLADDYQARASSALFVSVQRGFFLRGVEPQLYSSLRIRGWTLEARLRPILVDRFNEDYWRNPATGQWFGELFARGQRDDADTLASELRQGPLSLEAAGARLVQVLNA